jgi:HPt (histidine-containing phosphotransfer) domain-containing protein
MRDAKKSHAVLSAIMEKNGDYSDSDIRTYVIHTHGLKSALSYVGKMDLSAMALKLEQEGRESNKKGIKSDTPKFLELLKEFISELQPDGDIEDDKHESEEEIETLRQKLLVIRAACEEYDELVAGKEINELREKTWSKPVRDLLGTIDEHMLHSDFDEIVTAVDEFLENQ